MKKSLRILLIILIGISPLSGCKLSLKHYEDKLYSEKNITDYIEHASEQNPNIFTREKAIEKVINVFDVGLNIKIDKTKLTESIRLYKDSSEDTFKWQITWTDPLSHQSYYSIVDSSNGEILTINTHSLVTSEPQRNYYEITQAELAGIVTPLLSALEIDINDYNYKPFMPSKVLKGTYYMNESNIYFFNANNSKTDFSVLIDFKNKKILSYTKVNPANQY